MEYLSRAEVRPHRDEFRKIIEKVREIVRESKISFTVGLIGSAKRNLVLCHHNKGYDCDYKILIQKNLNNLCPKKLKKAFMDAFDAVIVPMRYSHCQDSTQSITFRKVVPEESRVEKGFDVIITKNYDDGVHILRNDKNNNPGDYHFTIMRDSGNFHDRYSQIKGNDMWQHLREEYKKKREANESLSEEQQKKGFHLLSDTVNETIQKFAM